VGQLFTVAIKAGTVGSYMIWNFALFELANTQKYSESTQSVRDPLYSAKN
jgi:hypothetical protein